MNRIDPKLAATLRQPAELVERGLAKAADLADLERVAARYAIAVTPRYRRPDRHGKPRRSDRAAIHSERARIGEHIRRKRRSDRRRRAFARPRHRPPLSRPRAVQAGACLRGVLPVLFSPRDGRAGQGDARCRKPPIARRWNIFATHTEIWEVILTGGDPLMLSPRRLSEIMADLAAIDHVKIVRIHTRVPVAAPARIDEDMVEALRVDGATTWIAVHANHPRELSGEARAGLRAAGGCRHSPGQPDRAAPRRQ